MPVTPFHIGIGLLAKGCSVRRFSLVGFCATQVAIDVESGYCLLYGGWPLHRGLHTFVGAALVSTVVVAMCRWLGSRRKASATIGPTLVRLVSDDLHSLRSPAGFLVTVALGALGHVLPDAVMHADVRAFAPLTDWNPFFGAVGLSTLHWALVISGVLGSAIMLARWARWRGSRR